MRGKQFILAAFVLVGSLVASAQPSSAAIAPVVKSALRPVGSAILSDAQAAAKVRSALELRPSNTLANRTTPTAAQLTEFRSHKGQWGNCDNLRAKVTGNFTGTTDEILQWAAWKWGLPEHAVRAVAVNETWWKMSFVGDSGMSYGIMQIKNVAAWHGGTYPISKNSTAFNADYWAGMVRQYFEGCSPWMKDYAYNGSSYQAGDFWGAVGAWYAGNWHSNAANTYITQVKRHMNNKTWNQAGF